MHAFVAQMQLPSARTARPRQRKGWSDGPERAAIWDLPRAAQPGERQCQTRGTTGEKITVAPKNRADRPQQVHKGQPRLAAGKAHVGEPQNQRPRP